MLTINQYKTLYPKESFRVESFNGLSVGRIISEGFLEFTKDSASSWGGPFHGNYARFVLSDYTNNIVESGANKGKKVLDVWDDKFKELVRKFESGFHPHLSYVKDSRDYASNEKPIRLWLLGNDDTSYSKFYSKESEALEELNIFIGNEPLDYNEVVRGFNFIFTN